MWTPNSHFYPGKTTFGGANLRKNIRRLRTTPYARSNVQTIDAKPSALSRQSNSFSAASEDSHLSSVTRRVLESLEKAAAPVQEGKRRYSAVTTTTSSASLFNSSLYNRPSLSTTSSAKRKKLFDTSAPSVRYNGRCSTDLSHKPIKYVLTRLTDDETPPPPTSTAPLPTSKASGFDFGEAAKATINQPSIVVPAFDKSLFGVSSKPLPPAFGSPPLNTVTPPSASSGFTFNAQPKPSLSSAPLSPPPTVSETPSSRSSSSLFTFSTPASITSPTTIGDASNTKFCFSSPVVLFNQKDDDTPKSNSSSSSKQDENSKPDSCDNSSSSSTVPPQNTATLQFDKWLTKKPAANTWSCPTCCVDNEMSDDKCVSCEEPNPSKKVAPAPTVNNSSTFTFGAFATKPAAEKIESSKPSSTETKSDVAPLPTSKASLFNFGEAAKATAVPALDKSLFGVSSKPLPPSSTLSAVTPPTATLVSETSSATTSSSFTFSTPAPTTTSIGNASNAKFCFSPPAILFNKKDDDSQKSNSNSKQDENSKQESCDNTATINSGSGSNALPSNTATLQLDKWLMKKPAANTWSCPTCCVDNEMSDDKCVSCEEPNPSKKVASAPTLNNSSAFTFGAFATKPAAEKIESSKPSPTETKSDVAQAPKVSETPPATTSSSLFAFSVPAPVTTTAPIVPTTSFDPKFSFGSPITLPKIDVGPPLQINSKLNINFSQASNSSSSTATPASKTPLFTFGSQNASTSSSTVPTFGSKASVEKVDVKFNFPPNANSQNASSLFGGSAASGTFIFGGKPTAPNANSSSLFAFGAKLAEASQPPPPQPAAAAAAQPQSTPFSFQAPSAVSNNTTGFNFGQSASTTQSQPTPFSFQAPAAASSNTGFSFGQAASATQSNANSSNLFTFGAKLAEASQAPPPAAAQPQSTPFSFQAPSAVSNNTTGFNFGQSASTTQSQPTPFSFQAPSGASSNTGFSFGQAAPPAPAVPSFGTMFGASQQPQQPSQPSMPTFGSANTFSAPALPGNSGFKFNESNLNFSTFAASQAPPAADANAGNMFAFVPDPSSAAAPANRTFKKAKRRLR